MKKTNWMMRSLVVVMMSLAGVCLAGESLRQVISLDGVWQIAEGTMTNAPTAFNRTVPVPGLVDMAQPGFEEVGVKSARREAFWYRRTFRLKQPVSAVAQLKLHKAMFGSRVILNGHDLGEHQPSFTPGYFDVKTALKQGENEIFIRIGAYPTAGAKSIGWDLEKKRYIPGLFDSVELILTGTPHIDRVQAVPDLEKRAVTVHTWPAGPAHFIVREVRSHRLVGEADGTGPVTIPIANCRLWTPDEPFLYELTVRTSGDELTTRFGMRTFRLDPQTGRAILNGKPYFMRGSNVTLYRFFEDQDRGALPWNDDWVRKLHRRFKEMHWNSLRYCIGFPPEFWYRIADEEGILIQDEFPIWMPFVKPGEISADELAQQYREWMQERWNHPCVAIWDACNETTLPETGAALAKVRGLDFSNRPWDNGWYQPARASDSWELHPYHFINPSCRLENLARDPGTLDWAPGKSPIIVNEYGWLWLNRDGTPTTLTKQLYENLLGPHSTTEQRRQLYARYMAAETEFWRSHRACAAVLHFCALGYSRPDGQTSDHWLDVQQLAWEPEFKRYVRDAFAPVGLMIDAWAEEYPGGKPREIPVVVINDTYGDWHGKVQLRLYQDSKILEEDSRPCHVSALGREQITFNVHVPAQAADYRLEALLVGVGGQEVRSLRDFGVFDEARRRASYGLAVGKPVRASSNVATCGATSPEAVADGRNDTRWSSEFSDPQWIAIDLGRVERISRVLLEWEAAYAKTYSIDVSLDGQTWKTVYRTSSGKGGLETIRFAPTDARWVRMTGTERATKYGYSLWEMGVFAE